MKTPDKIYISQGLSKEAVKALSLHLNDKDICYIRKDALLEYLNGLDTSSHYERFVIDNLIEHINSL